ncbi:hypothetical protein [Methylophilus sp. YYY-1]|uniref:hypothetical protein n=1 Tax=Methylophilus sp. YYY-1 TaxID=2682087 RepID=UPI0023B20EAD|nr:hypothetical protein [Methylophilus sp. YYY-1]MDF0377692.1 hypothetical protein [Methylophilus sp. YYY-1]
MQTKTYQCLEPIRHNGKDYMPPGTIDLTDEEANLLVDCDAVVEIEGDAESDPPAGTPSGESTAAADALAEQADKETNHDPLNNKDGGDATLAAQTNAAASTNIEEANGPAAAEGNASATPEAPEASAPGAEGNLIPASADAVQDPADPAPAVDSTAGGDGQTILDAATTTLDGSATGVVAALVVAEALEQVAPVQADQAPADPAQADQASSEAPKKTRKAKAAD